MAASSSGVVGIDWRGVAKPWGITQPNGDALLLLFNGDIDAAAVVEVVMEVEEVSDTSLNCTIKSTKIRKISWTKDENE